MASIKWTTEDDDGNEVTYELPATWEVCGTCRGDGQIPDRRLSPCGDGAYTQSEFYEMYDSPEDRDAYFSGRYDVTCHVCDGRTTVQLIDWDRFQDEMPEVYEKYMREQEAEARYQAMCDAERRFGC